jgi:hypothetical protein
MKRFLLAGILASSACAGLTGKEAVSGDFDAETSAADLRIKEDRARSALSKVEASIADYYKVERKIPSKLDALIPKYLAEVPILDLPVCGRESSRVQYYPAEVLRGGQVDGSRLLGTGRWGYAFNDGQVVFFVDCLKTSSRGIPWYQERGVY